MKKHKYIDTNFYKLFLELLRFYSQYYKNLPKEYKFTIGKQLFEHILECVKLNINSYYNSNINNKYKYANECYDNLIKIEVYLKLLSDLHIITIQQLSNLSKQTAEIKINLTNWINSLNNKIEDTT